jgi:hypothetical protein
MEILKNLFESFFVDMRRDATDEDLEGGRGFGSGLTGG